MQKIFGYIRVSSKDQNIARQVEDFKKLNIDERDIFIDYESGKDFKREKYISLKHCLRPGDLLYVKSIDRFGRNYKEILHEWNELTNIYKIDIKVISMPLLDTTQYKDLLGSFISDLTLQILSFVAEIERVSIKQRLAEGIAIARRKGIKIGRPKISIPDNFQSYYDKWKNGNITAKFFMEALSLKRTTFYSLVKEYEYLSFITN